MKKKGLILIVPFLIGILFCGLVACTEEPLTFEQRMEIEFAGSPLYADSESGSSYSWRSFHCATWASANTSLFDPDNVAFEFSFEGDFSDENAARSVTTYKEVDFCDLSKLQVKIVSSLAEENTMPYEFAAETVAELTRERDYPDGTCTITVRVPKDFFLFAVGEISVFVQGESRRKGDLSAMSRSIRFSYWNRGNKVLLSEDRNVFYDKIPYLLTAEDGTYRYDPYKRPVELIPSGDGFLSWDRAGDALLRTDYCGYLLEEEKVTIPVQVVDDRVMHAGSIFTAAYDLYRTDRGYAATEDVNILFFFGSVAEGADRYDVVEICCANEGKEENAIVLCTRTDYASETYDVNRIVSLDRNALYLDYRHSEIVTLPADFAWGREGNLRLMLMGKSGEERTLLAEVKINYFLHESQDKTSAVLTLIDEEHSY